MNKPVICDKCGELFSPGEMQTVASGEYQTQYFVCPYCGFKAHVLTTNEKMRGLIEQRRAIARKVKLGRLKKFREKTLQGYLDEDGKLKAEQEKLLPTLKKKGKEILRAAEEGGTYGEKHFD